MNPPLWIIVGYVLGELLTIWLKTLPPSLPKIPDLPEPHCQVALVNWLEDIP